jgi:ribose 5-phosphate isomerase
LREKVLAEAAETWIIVADYRKNSQLLGTTVSPVSPGVHPHTLSVFLSGLKESQ